jgi:hypothetical protein
MEGMFMDHDNFFIIGLGYTLDLVETTMRVHDKNLSELFDREFAYMKKLFNQMEKCAIAYSKSSNWNRDKNGLDLGRCISTFCTFANTYIIYACPLNLSQEDSEIIDTLSSVVDVLHYSIMKYVVVSGHASKELLRTNIKLTVPKNNAKN